MTERARFQFRLRDLFCAVCLIGVSLGLFLVSPQVAKRAYAAWDRTPWLALLAVLTLASAATFGAGLGFFFQRPIAGAIVGLLVMLFLAACALLWAMV